MQPHAADPQALFSSRRWFLQARRSGGRVEGRAAVAPPADVTLVREHGDGIVASVRRSRRPQRRRGIALRGAASSCRRQSFRRPMTADEYYWVDLIGLGGQPRGRAAGHAPSPDDRHRAALRDAARPKASTGRRRGAHERMIPLRRRHIDGVDLPGRRITRRLGPRLLTCRRAGACRRMVMRFVPDLFPAVRPVRWGVTRAPTSRARSTCGCGRCATSPTTNYRRVDDRPYGGGPGMVMLVEPLERALAALRRPRPSLKVRRRR